MKMNNTRKTERIAINLTPFQKNLIDLLIREHYADTGILLSKSQFVMAHLQKSLEIARDHLLLEGSK